MLRRAIGHKSRGPPQWRVIVTRGSTAGPKSTREFIRAKESICSKPCCIGTIRQRGSEPFVAGGNLISTITVVGLRVFEGLFATCGAHGTLFRSEA